MLKLISHNPFRFLGVFGNASKKEIAASENKIKAFLKVDKEIGFQLDSIPELPKVKRDFEGLAKALRELERPIDELNALLFWFINQTPIDKVAFNHLTAGNIHKAIEIWSKVNNLSSNLNRLTAYTIIEDWGHVAESADELLSNLTYVTDICNIVSDTLPYDSSKLIRLYLEAICKESPATLWKIYQAHNSNPKGSSIEEQLDTEWNFQIREVLATYYIRKTEEQLDDVLKTPKDDILERARKMHQLLKKVDWNVCQEVIGNGVELSRLKDKVASEGIQVAIDLYNKSDEPSKVAHMSLDLAQMSLNTSVRGSLVYQRCEENLNTLKDICAALPPEEVAYYDNLLRPIIKAYQNKPSTVDNASYFINACAPYLMSIRAIVGINHKYYIKICTRIAEDTLSDLIAYYNDQSEKLHKKLENSNRQNRDAIIKSLQDMMEKTVIAMYHLKFLGLDPNFRIKRLDNNFSTVVEQARGARVFARWSSFIEGATSEREFNEELAKYPLDQRDEDAYFTGIKSLKDCYLYHKIFPDGKYSKQLVFKVEEYEYKECATLEDLVKFKVRYPASKYDTEKKREEIIFNGCKTIEDYKAYLKTCIRFRKEAESRIDDLTFLSCKDINDYQTYLSTFPNGNHKSEAVRAIDDQFYEICSTKCDYQTYLQHFPNGQHAIEAREHWEEEISWIRCEVTDNWKEYKKHLDQFPNGKYSKIALEKAYSPRQKIGRFFYNHGCLLMIICLVGLIFLIGGLINGREGLETASIIVVIGGLFVCYMWYVLTSK